MNLLAIHGWLLCTNGEGSGGGPVLDRDWKRQGQRTGTCLAQGNVGLDIAANHPTGRNVHGKEANSDAGGGSPYGRVVFAAYPGDLGSADMDLLAVDIEAERQSVTSSKTARYLEEHS
jgi:hypothetical protein